MFFKNIFYVILFEGEKVIYGSVEREDISSSLAFKLYIWVGEILLRIGPIITLAVLNTLIIYKFLRIAKRRHQLKRYSELSSNGLPSENMNVGASQPRASQTVEVIMSTRNSFIYSIEETFSQILVKLIYFQLQKFGRRIANIHLCVCHLAQNFSTIYIHRLHLFSKTKQSQLQ